MFNMHMPKPYWDDVVLTGVYLINPMPSSILNNKSPFSLLYPGEPSFSLTPRVFDCVAFVHVLRPGQDKLSPHSIKCIFWDILVLKNVIGVMFLSLVDTTLALMLPSSSHLLFSETGQTITFD
jgi:hypothetical protein